MKSGVPRALPWIGNVRELGNSARGGSPLGTAPERPRRAPLASQQDVLSRAEVPILRGGTAEKGARSLDYFLPVQRSRLQRGLRESPRALRFLAWLSGSREGASGSVSMLVGNRRESGVPVKRRERGKRGPAAVLLLQYFRGHEGGIPRVLYQHCHSIFRVCFVFAVHFVNTTRDPAVPFCGLINIAL